MEEANLTIGSNCHKADYVTKIGMLKKLGTVKNWKIKQFELDGLTLKCYDPKDLTYCSPRLVIPLHRIISIQGSTRKEFCFKISTISKEYIIQAKSKSERESWMKAIQINIESEYIRQRYFTISGPIISEESKKTFYMLLGHNYILATEEIRGLNSTYSFKTSNILKVDHRDLVEAFDSHMHVSQVWAPAIRHNSNTDINSPLYCTFKQVVKVNSVNKMLILSSHYIRIFKKAEDPEAETIIPIYECDLLDQCKSGSLELLQGKSKYTIVPSTESNALMLYAMFKYNLELAALIQHKFSPPFFFRKHVQYIDIHLWMELTENNISLYSSADSCEMPRNFIKLSDIDTIEKCVSLRGIFEDPKSDSEKVVNPIFAGKYRNESKIPKTSIMQLKIGETHSLYLKMEISDKEIKKLLLQMEKAVFECKEHEKLQEKEEEKDSKEEIDQEKIMEMSRISIRNNTLRKLINRPSTGASVSTRASVIYRFPASYVETDVGGKKDNEDTFCNLDVFEIPSTQDKQFVLTTFSYYGLYDGHGGAECSQIAKEMMHAEIVKTKGWQEQKIIDALDEGFQETEKNITKEAAQNKYMSGTTAVSAIITKQGENMDLYIANVGDTEAIVAIKTEDNVRSHMDRKNSIEDLDMDTTHHFELLTEKHNPTLQSEKERVEKAEGMIIRDRIMGRIAVSRSLGDIPFKHPFNQAPDHWVSPKPHLLHLKLESRHKFIIIATDGLWDVISYQQATDLASNYLASAMHPQQVCRCLVTAAIEGGSLDNITVILIILSPV